MRANSDQDAAQTAAELKKKHMRTFKLKTLALIPISLFAWLLAVGTPNPAAFPVVIFVGGVIILAVDGFFAYRAEKRAAQGRSTVSSPAVERAASRVED